MGCKSSKNNYPSASIDPNFPLTGNSTLDTFFQSSSSILKEIEGLRIQTNAKKQHGTMLAGTSHLSEAPYTKAVEVLFWALSAEHQGKIANSGIIIRDKSPFLMIRNVGQCQETIDLADTLREYLSLLIEGTRLLELEVMLEGVRNEQIKMKRKIGPGMSAKTMQVCDDNMKKLNEGISTGARVLGQLMIEQKDARELVGYMQSIAGVCDEVGARAYKEKLVKPAEIYKWVESEGGKKHKKVDSIVNHNEIVVQDQEGIVEKHRRVDSNVDKYVSFGDIQNGFGVISMTAYPGKENNQSIDADDSNVSNANKQLVKKLSNGPHSKGRTFVREKGLELSINGHGLDDMEKKKQKGYLSPGGTKQAGILQGEENVLDDEDMMVEPAHDSFMIKNFTEKTQGCFVMKE